MYQYTYRYYVHVFKQEMNLMSGETRLGVLSPTLPLTLYLSLQLISLLYQTPDHVAMR